METTRAPSLKTELNDRVLWYDGDSTIPASKVTEMLAAGLPVEGMFVEALTDDIKQYNKLVSSAEQIGIKQDIKALEYDWVIPDKYKKLDVAEYVVDRFIDERNRTHFSKNESKARIQRVKQELALYENMQLLDILRVLIFVINTLQAQKVVWGVGRGSSVSSYVLYLIGVHDVDSVQYDLDINDFLHD